MDATLELIRLKRKDVFITNIIHCHPPKNRAATDRERENCQPYLTSEISIVQPDVIVLLGTYAQQSMPPIAKRFSLLRVKHPAYFLRKGGRGSKDWILSLALKLEKYSCTK